MVLVADRLPDGARLVLNIHDELIVECPADDAEEVHGILTRSMTEGMNRIYPEMKIEAEASICSNWAGK